MLSGMATRMAYALQLHRELDYDPLGQKADKQPELSFTDREIRRRAMWSSLLMDRFTASGTERPMFADEETVKIQLPIRESRFQMDIAGPTENLDGSTTGMALADSSQLGAAKDNMGVAAYMVRVLTMWGRTLKYLNMGGKKKNSASMWDPESRFSRLKKEALDFRDNLPSELRNTEANLRNHATEKTANQFIFLHVAANQVILFLNRHAMPTTPTSRIAENIPKAVLTASCSAAIEAALTIARLLEIALDHNAVAPFIGYCAFYSGTMHVWGIFSKNVTIEGSCQRGLQNSIRYLSKMENYWGMISFMVKNLKDIYKQYVDAAGKGISDASEDYPPIFQYGDWFGRYPRGFPQIETGGRSPQVKTEVVEEVSLSQKSDLQTADEFIKTSRSPPTVNPALQKSKKPPKKSQKASSTHLVKSTTSPQSQNPSRTQSYPDTFPDQKPPTNIIPMAEADANQPPITPYTPTHPPLMQNLYQHSQPNLAFSDPHDLLPFNTLANTGLLPQLDRSLVYDAYMGNNDLNTMSNFMNQVQTEYPGGLGTMWNPNEMTPMDISQQHAHQQHHHQQQQEQQQGLPQQQDMMSQPPHGNLGHVPGPDGMYASDVQTSAWFMPFNILPPGIDGTGGHVGH